MRLAIPTLILAIILVLGWRVCSGGERDHLRLTEEDLPVELREGYDGAGEEAREAAEASGGGLESLPEQAATATPAKGEEAAGNATADGVEFASRAAADNEVPAVAKAGTQLAATEKPVEPVEPAIDAPLLPSVSASSSADSAEASDSEGRVYVVQPGDWLMKIARDQYGDASAAGKIARRNGLNDADQLKPGQKLILP